MSSKPSIVYYGSIQRIVGAIQPVQEHAWRKTPSLLETAEDVFADLERTPLFSDEQARVIAHEDVHRALLSLIPKEVSQIVSPTGSFVQLYLLGSEEEFRKKDKGGYLYSLPTETFEPGPQTGEWWSAVPVIPQEVRHIPSTIEAFREFGLRFFFVEDPEEFDRMWR